jgi:hypothetical protein
MSSVVQYNWSSQTVPLLLDQFWVSRLGSQIWQALTGLIDAVPLHSPSMRQPEHVLQLAEAPASQLASGVHAAASTLQLPGANDDNPTPASSSWSLFDWGAFGVSFLTLAAPPSGINASSSLVETKSRCLPQDNAAMAISPAVKVVHCLVVIGPPLVIAVGAKLAFASPRKHLE